MLEDFAFWGVTTLAATVLGTISYFLKRTMNRADKSETDIAVIKEDFVKKRDFEKQQEKQDNAIKEIRDNYTPIETHVKDFDEAKQDIKEIKNDMLKKEDFIREISDLRRSFEKSQEKTNDLFMKYMGGN